MLSKRAPYASRRICEVIGSDRSILNRVLDVVCVLYLLLVTVDQIVEGDGPYRAMWLGIAAVFVATTAARVIVEVLRRRCTFGKQVAGAGTYPRPRGR